MTPDGVEHCQFKGRAIGYSLEFHLHNQLKQLFWQPWLGRGELLKKSFDGD